MIAPTLAAERDAALPRPARARHRRPPLVAIAAEEFRRVVESRWLFAFAALLAAMVLGLSFFGLVQSGEIGFQGFDRVTLSLLNLVLFVVPLVGLLLGVTSLTGDTNLLPLLLAQPVRRRDVLIGKALGLVAALSAAQAAAFGAGGVIVATQAGADHVPGFVVLTLLSMVLGALMVATGLALAAAWPDRLRAVTGAVLLWLALVVLYDLAVFGATSLLAGVPLQRVLLPALLVNPVDLVRVLVVFTVGSGALFGPTSAVLMQWMGTSSGLAIGIAALVVQTLVPLAVAVRLFERRDW